MLNINLQLIMFKLSNFKCQLNNLLFVSKFMDDEDDEVIYLWVHLCVSVMVYNVMMMFVLPMMLLLLL